MQGAETVWLESTIDSLDLSSRKVLVSVRQGSSVTGGLRQGMVATQVSSTGIEQLDVASISFENTLEDHLPETLQLAVPIPGRVVLIIERVKLNLAVDLGSTPSGTRGQGVERKDCI